MNSWYDYSPFNLSIDLIDGRIQKIKVAYKEISLNDYGLF